MRKKSGDAKQQYGILVSFPSAWKEPWLLTERSSPDAVYRTGMLKEAEREARVYLGIFQYTLNTRSMSTSVVPLEKGDRFGPAIKKYRFNDAGRIVQG